jgi:O-antigen/teichoic acid export membrane protein
VDSNGPSTVVLMTYPWRAMAASEPTVNTFSTDHLKADLRNRSVRGGLLTVSSQGMQIILLSVGTVVLAHILTPSDYGLVAMVTAITGLGQAFADLGLSEATIQNADISQDQVSKLFWINVSIGLILTAITASLGPLFAWFYREPRLVGIALVCSLLFFTGGLRVQHDALLRRNMRFAALAIRDVVAVAIATPTAIILAWRGAGYWAIVAGPLIVNTIQVILSWVLAGWMPGIPRNDAKVGSLVKFGGYVAASYFTLNFTNSADCILVGWYWGAGPLGLYSKAMNLLLLPVRQLSGPAQSVAVTTFSRIQDDADRLARFYLRAANVLVWIAAPIFGFLFVAATPVIILTLGTKWRAAGPVFQLLAIFALGQLLYQTLIWLFISRGQSKRLMVMVLFMCPIAVCGYLIGLPFGIRGIALTGAATMLLAFPWILKYSFRGTALTLVQLGRRIFWPITASLAGIVFGEAALRAVSHWPTVLQLLVVGAAFGGGCSLTLVFRPVREEVNGLREVLRSALSGSRSQALEACD